jgi:hypothetical protein
MTRPTTYPQHAACLSCGELTTEPHALCGSCIDGIPRGAMPVLVLFGELDGAYAYQSVGPFGRYTDSPSSPIQLDDARTFRDSVTLGGVK